MPREANLHLEDCTDVARRWQERVLQTCRMELLQVSLLVAVRQDRPTNKPRVSLSGGSRDRPALTL